MKYHHLKQNNRPHTEHEERAKFLINCCILNEDVLNMTKHIQNVNYAMKRVLFVACKYTF